jgi:hypothetical protein
MQLPESIGAREIAIGVGVIVVLLIVAVPLLGYVGDQSKRSEPQLIVESIRAAQLAQGRSFPLEGYVSADWAPRQPTSLDGSAVPWTTNDGFTRLGWSPEAEGYSAVRCAYKVAASRDDFTVTARCDLDGDGQQAWYEATRDQPATLRSESGAR